MVKKNIIIEDARIGFRNFSGEEGKFNPKGNRNFCVFLETPFAEELENDGWNIKWLPPREEGDEEQAYMQVSVNYRNIPPKIMMISSNNKTLMTEDMVEMLDWAELEQVDLIIRPYNWEVNGKRGVKAYLKSMYAVLEENELDRKYSDYETTYPGQSRDDGDEF